MAAAPPNARGVANSTGVVISAKPQLLRPEQHELPVQNFGANCVALGFVAKMADAASGFEPFELVWARTVAKKWAACAARILVGDLPIEAS